MAFRVRALVRLSLAAALAAAAVTGIAEGQPSPPDDVQVFSCGGGTRMTPHICASFHNTASERVGFWFEWTRNGQKLPSSLDPYDAVCLDANHDCGALYWFKTPPLGGNASRKYTQEREYHFGIRVKDVDYDTEFCFRFKTVDDDGVASDNWSTWKCATTGSEPPAPETPKQPLVITIEPESGRGRVGEAEPAKLLVEWEPVVSRDAVGWYELVPEGPVNPTAQVDRLNREGPYEKVFELPEGIDRDKRYGMRVCAVNVLHRKCSPVGFVVRADRRLSDSRDQTKVSTPAPPGTSRFKPGTPATSDAAAVGTARRPASTTAGATSVAGGTSSAPRTLGKRKKPVDPNATHTLGKRKRPGGPVATTAVIYVLDGDSMLLRMRHTGASRDDEGTFEPVQELGALPGNAVARLLAGGLQGVFGVSGTGGLSLVRGFETGTTFDEPKAVEGEWNEYRHLVVGTHRLIYGVTADGGVDWFKPSGGEGDLSLTGPVRVATGWTDVARVFAGGNYVLYVVTRGGDLLRYRHDDAPAGGTAWSGPVKVAAGFSEFTQVFSSGDGAIYGVLPSGDLVWHRDVGYKTGAPGFEGPVTASTGWEGIRSAVAALP